MHSSIRITYVFKQTEAAQKQIFWDKFYPVEAKGLVKFDRYFQVASWFRDEDPS
jgi:hypothetical protein